MRSVDKGAAPKTYSSYRDAKPDLVQRIGGYCSYCEMPIKHKLELEHVIPQSNGGAPLDWHNFLLSCQQCNNWKKNKNFGRNGFLWPDIDHTVLAYRQLPSPPAIIPEPKLPPQISSHAQATLDLVEIFRSPNSTPQATAPDFRWFYRQQTWDIAQESLTDWKADPTPGMARQIGRTAVGQGFYSIWLTVFDGIDEVVTEIKSRFPGTYEPQVDANGNLLTRPGGTF